MKARIKWVENVSFIAESGSGHAFLMDGAPEGGGRNMGPRPMEVVLMGTGGCTAYDVVHILRKSRAPVSDCVVEIDAERAEEDPKVFTKIHFHFIVTGSGDAKISASTIASLNPLPPCPAPSTSHVLAHLARLACSSDPSQQSHTPSFTYGDGKYLPRYPLLVQ